MKWKRRSTVRMACSTSCKSFFYPSRKPITDRINSRGKKVFKKFENDDYNIDPDEEAETEEDVGRIMGDEDFDIPSTIKPLTRKSVKPRLLFPTEAQRRAREEAAEEDTTDIEDANKPEDTEMQIQEQAEPDEIQQDDAPSTPAEAIKSTPDSPPVSTRSLRSSMHKSSGTDSATGTGATKRSSPFDSWRRSKGSVARAGSPRRPGKGKKRTGSMTAETTSAPAISKKQKRR